MSHIKKQDHTTASPSVFNNISYDKFWPNAFNSLEQLPEKSIEVLTYMWNRVPNIKETVTTVVPTVALEMLIGDDFIKKLGSNPGNKNVFRDSVKTFSLTASYLTGTTLGGTDTKYDLGHVFGQGYKVGCKLLYMKISPKPLKDSARDANYFCDTSARIFPLTSQFRQAENTTDVNYAYDLVIRIFTTPLALQVGAQGLLKAGVADKIGAVIESVGIEKQLSSIGDLVQYGIMKSSSSLSLLSPLIKYTTEFVNKCFIQSVISTIYSPPVRIVQDAAVPPIKIAMDQIIDILLPQQQPENDILVNLENEMAKKGEAEDENASVCENVHVKLSSEETPIEIEHNSESPYGDSSDNDTATMQHSEDNNIAIDITGEPHQ